MKNLLFLLFFVFTLVSVAIAGEKDSVVVLGQIENSQKYLKDATVVNIRWRDGLFQYPVVLTSDIDGKGCFRFSFSLGHSQQIYCRYNNTYFDLLIKPGDTLLVTFDADDVDGTLCFSGDSKLTNENIRTWKKEKKAWDWKNYRNRMDTIRRYKKDSSADVYKSFILSLYQSDLKYYSEFIKEHQVSELFKTWAKAEMVGLCTYHLNSYAQYNEIPLNYEDLIYRFPFTDINQLASAHFGIYINNIYFYLLETKMDKDYPESSYNIVQMALEYVYDNDLYLSVEDRQTVHKFMMSDSSASLDLSHSDTVNINRILGNHTDSINAYLVRKKILAPTSFDYLSQNTTGLLRAALLSRNLYHGMVQFKKIDFVGTRLNKYRSLVKDEKIENLLLQVYQHEKKLLDHPETVKIENLFDMTNSKKNKLLHSIIQRHKGEVVYMDFWFSACIPCRLEMPHSVELQHYFKDKKVAFIYLCSFTDGKVWKSDIVDLHLEKGENYLLNNNQNKILAAQFQIGGYPHYVLIDKNGDVIDANAIRPSNPDLKKKIETLLEE